MSFTRSKSCVKRNARAMTWSDRLLSTEAKSLLPESPEKLIYDKQCFYYNQFKILYLFLKAK